MEVGGVTQPTALHDVVTDGAGDKVVLVRVATVDKELGHAIAHWRPLDVLAQRPPAIVVHLAHLLIRTVEKGNILMHPLNGLGVGDGGDDVLILHGVEAGDVVGNEGLTATASPKERGVVTFISVVATDIGQGEPGHATDGVGEGLIEKLVGGGVDARLAEERAGAEDDARDALHGGIKLAGAFPGGRTARHSNSIDGAVQLA